MHKIQILSVNLSENKGPKVPMKEIYISPEGVDGDKHFGTERPISIFAIHHSERFTGITGSRKPEFGEFAENITVNGLEETEVMVFDRFRAGEVELEVVKVGKPFHDEFKELGNYVMPRVGIFCRVKSPGALKPGDKFDFLPKHFRILIITLSDRASKGIYEDLSGPAIRGHVDKVFSKNNKRFEIESLVIPDDAEQLGQYLQFGKTKFDVIFTTGGTGIGPKDFTVDVVKPMLDKEIPGIMEMIRMKYGMEKPNAYLSRGVAGVMGQSLIYTLPGSVKAVNEYMTEIAKTLDHLIYMKHGVDVH
ncbi:MAG: MOSC domain-containing protein [Bacteroidales bacterium]|nr:MOSC domain-containing protein [Bacteroidales bacterium]MCF8455427.1 MOSC domain-containing protein [Bacteroidales bacterium]